MIEQTKRGTVTHSFIRLVRKKDGKDYWVRYYCNVVGAKTIRALTWWERFKMYASNNYPL